MAVIVPDFSEAFDDSPIPDGVYNVRIMGSYLKESKAGNPYVSWQLAIYGAEGPRASYNGRNIFHMTMITGKGSGSLKTLWKAATGEDPAGQVDTEVLHGREVQVVLKERLMPDGTPSSFPQVQSVRPVQ